MERSLDTQLVKYLTDVHSIEEQALAQLRRAPEIAGNAAIANIFERHLHETELQEELVRNRLEAHSEAPSKAKDAAGQAGGFGMVLFARSQPDTPGKLVAHAFAYEHMELAAYELLGRVASRAGDGETASIAARIAGEEEAMASRLAASFDQAVEASLEEPDPEYLSDQLDRYLADAHAIENQAIELLKRGQAIAGDGELEQAFSEHLAETEAHQRRVGERLEERDASPSTLKDAVLRLGALNLGAFFAAQPDTPAKLAGFAFAFEHLEIAGYELLRRVAERARDPRTVEAVDEILDQERAAAAKIAALWDTALDASLDALGVTT
jgi:ferritin-like metal-binding protein YciE